MQAYDEVQQASIARSAEYLRRKQRITESSQDDKQDIIVMTLWIAGVICFGCFAAVLM